MPRAEAVRLRAAVQVGGGGWLAMCVAMAAGRRRGVWRELRLGHAAVRQHLDPRDRGEGVELSEAKAARSWRSMACVRTAGGGLVHPREGCIEAAQVAAQAMRYEQVL